MIPKKVVIFCVKEIPSVKEMHDGSFHTHMSHYHRFMIRNMK